MALSVCHDGTVSSHALITAYHAATPRQSLFRDITLLLPKDNFPVTHPAIKYP
jgi:hypothetical protein